jgi:cytoskeletal protein CcmA (bactofilin family)
MIFPTKTDRSNRFSTNSTPTIAEPVSEPAPTDYYGSEPQEPVETVSSQRTLLPKSSNVLGRDVTISGELTFQNDLVIDGNVTGKISAVSEDDRSQTSGVLTIGENAVIQAEITSRKAIIRGSVEGNISVSESITLGSTAKLFGDIVARTLTVEPGATFIGHARISADSLNVDEPSTGASASEQGELPVGKN